MHDQRVKPPNFGIRLDQAIAADAIRQVKEGPRPVTIMQEGIVLVGDGSNAQPLNLSEGFVNVEQINAAFGDGSETGRMVHAALDTRKRETWKESEARRDREAFDKATKIDAKEYTGWVSWPGCGEDGFFKSVDALRKHCTEHELELPSFVWACTPDPMYLNEADILAAALEGHFDGALESISRAERERLQAFLDEWTAKQNIVSWHEDRTRAVILRANDEVAAEVCVAEPNPIERAYRYPDPPLIGPTMSFLLYPLRSDEKLNTTICGLDRKALKSALEWQAQEYVEEFMIHDMARLSDEPVKLCFAAIVDPEKLAEVVAELLRGSGWSVAKDGAPIRSFALPLVQAFSFDGKSVSVTCWETYDVGHQIRFTMQQVRAFVLALLNAPTATTQDVERMIQEATET